MQVAAPLPPNVVQDALGTIYRQAATNAVMLMPQSASQGVLSAIYERVMANMCGPAPESARQVASVTAGAQLALNAVYETSVSTVGAQNALGAVYETTMSTVGAKSALGDIYETSVSAVGVKSALGAVYETSVSTADAKATLTSVYYTSLSTVGAQNAVGSVYETSVSAVSANTALVSVYGTPVLSVDARSVLGSIYANSVSTVLKCQGSETSARRPSIKELKEVVDRNLQSIYQKSVKSLRRASVANLADLALQSIYLTSAENVLSNSHSTAAEVQQPQHVSAQEDEDAKGLSAKFAAEEDVAVLATSDEAALPVSALMADEADLVGAADQGAASEGAEHSETEVDKCRAEYEDRILAKAMLPDTYERCFSRARMRTLGRLAAMQIEVERYVGNLTEEIHQRFEFQCSDDSSGAGDSGAGVLTDDAPNARTEIINRVAVADEQATPIGEMSAAASDKVGDAQAVDVIRVEDMKSAQAEETPAAAEASAPVEASLPAEASPPAEVFPPARASPPAIVDRLGEGGQGTSNAATRVRGHIESMVQASISAGVARSKEVPQESPGTAMSGESEPLPGAEASHDVAMANEAAHAEVSNEPAPVLVYQPPASASALPRGDPPWSASSDFRAPPASAPGALSSMTGLDVRPPDVQSATAMSRQESFKVLAALYGPAADQKLAQRQSVSAGSAWSTRSAWSAGPGVSNISTTAPGSLQPTPPSTAPPASRVAARAKRRAVRQPQAEQYDEQGSHLIHKKHDPMRLRQLDQDRLRNRYVKNMHSLRDREKVTKRQEGVLQEYYWRMRDMEAEVLCRKQERSWQDREQVRRQDVEKRRQVLAEQNDDALNRRYGRFYSGQEGYMTTPVSVEQVSGRSSTQRAKEAEMEAVWQAEDLNLFQEAYQDAVGRMVSPDDDQQMPTGEQQESLGAQRSAMLSSRQPAPQAPPKRQANAAPSPRVVQREDVSWADSLRSPLTTTASPAPKPKEVSRRQRAVSSDATPDEGQNAEFAPTSGVGPPAFVSKALPAGLVEWESWRNPWRGRRRGVPPPVEAVVNAMLNGRPPINSASPEDDDSPQSRAMADFMRRDPRQTSGSIATLITRDRRGSNERDDERRTEAQSASPSSRAGSKLPPVQSARQADAGRRSPGSFSSGSDF